ncbi:MAG: hypothetical protein IJG40_12580 [Oscillospiraceae bacterium]|nr:hypothetical protein [Oscillospiraceae bacterium]
MLALKIIGILILIIFLICQIRVGVDISFVEKKLVLSVKLCGLLVQIYPRKNSKLKKPKQEEPKPEEKKPPKEKKPKKKKPKKEKKGPGLMISGDEIIELLKKVLDGLAKFSRGFSVDRFLLHWVAAGKDPCDTARLFASVNAILSSLAPYCAERFHCRNTDVRTDIVFTTDKMALDFGIAVVLRIGAVFSMLFTILFGVIGILIRNKLYWAKLKRTDPEEYRFQVENPGLVTKLIRSLLDKEKEPEGESAESPPAEADGSRPALQPQNDTNTITEQERKPTNGE